MVWHHRMSIFDFPSLDGQNPNHTEQDVDKTALTFFHKYDPQKMDTGTSLNEAQF